MEAVIETPAQATPELNLLLNWDQDRGRERNAGLLSASAHVLAVIGLLLIPRSVLMPPRAPERRVTPLIEPLTELTQRAPTKGKISKEISAPSTPQPRIHIPPAVLRTPRPMPEKSPAPRATPPPAIPEPPRIDTARTPPRDLPAGPQTAQVAPAPQIQPEEKPKLQFETPTAPAPSGGVGKIARPDTSVAGAIRNLAHDGAAGALTVGDDTNDAHIGGIAGGLRVPPSPSRPASSLQLLSDPMGVDFRPYLLQILAEVRRNWFAVYPESAKLGTRGRVQIQFAISKSGSVPKLVIVSASGAEALDRAAVAGISASNPFPPLPTGYNGDTIRLQFTFSYNMARN